MPSILVLIPGFGEPHWETKINLLRKNHQALVENLPPLHTLHYRILQYSMEPHLAIPTSLFEPLPPEQITIVRKPGILGNNLLESADPTTLNSFDYILMMLDDIEFFKPVQWSELKALLENQKYQSPRILSPCLKDSNSTAWDYMIHQPSWKEPTLVIRKRCEMFVYFMTWDAYRIYYSNIDPNNPFLWGTDFILESVLKLRPGILNHWVIGHYFRGTCPDGTHAERQAREYIHKLRLNYDSLHREPPGEIRILL